MKTIVKTFKYVIILIIAMVTAVLMSIIISNQLIMTATVNQEGTYALPEDGNTEDDSTISGIVGDNVEDKSLDDTGTILVEQEPSMGQGVWRPISTEGKDLEIYCVQPGHTIKISGLWKEDIEAWDGYVCSRSCGYCASWPSGTTITWGSYAGQKIFSNPYYYCQNNHITHESTEIYGNDVGNTYDIAYIVSFYPAKIAGQGMAIMDPDAWSGGKQYAVWKSALSQVGFPYDRTIIQTYVTEGESILKQAEVYQTMTEGIMSDTWKDERYPDKDDPNKTYDKVAGEMRIEPTEEELERMQDNIKIDTDYDTQLHKIGPFKLNYVYGWNSTMYDELTPSGNYPVSQYAMSGITEMYLLYEDENGQEQRMEISASIRRDFESIYAPIQGGPNAPRNGKGTGSTYDAFKPWSYQSPTTGQLNPNMVDFFSYNQWRNYPAPNEEFYVEVKCEEELPANMKLHVQYSYLSIKFFACIRDGVSYILEEGPHNHKYNPHEHCCGSCDDGGCCCWYDHWGCQYELQMTTTPRQNLVYVDYYREIITEEYEFPFSTVGATTMKVRRICI